MFTFIDRLTVTGDVAEFERVIAEISRHMATQPGFRSHRFYQSQRDPKVYVEIAEWQSAEHHRQATATDGFRRPLQTVIQHAEVDFAPYTLRAQHSAPAGATR
uniref:DacO5 n=1 Tax=Dactylosporangium sp. SC14051 TaxID=1239282 RepID=K4IA37_9ACTN|nr:DacO5 [Dactylosporangium sp. SC14051]